MFLQISTPGLHYHVQDVGSQCNIIVLTNSYSSIKCHPKKKKKLCQVISIIIKYWRNLSTSSELSHSTSKLCQMISIIILEKSLDIFGIIPFYLKISKLIPNIRYLRKLSNKIPFFLLQNKEWYILILIRKINYLTMQCQEVLYVICIVSNHRSNILLRTYLTILVIIMFVEGRLHLII